MPGGSESVAILVRLGCFVAAFAVFAYLEAKFPRRVPAVDWRVRWPGNIAVSAINQLILRLLLPVSALLLAERVAEGSGGLLNVIPIPFWLKGVVAVLLLDLILYVQHRVFHAVPMLWYLHRMHHADTGFDVTTGIRFHPASILVSAFIKLGAVYVLGPPAIAVLVFEILLNATSLFNHSNLRIPSATERILRAIVVTPDMHRVHHSVNPSETNSNFGFNFPWWDRWFGTYVARPERGMDGMRIGLEQFRDESELRLDRMLTQPFRGVRS